MTADTPNIDKAGERESLRLCYVEGSRAWFTSQDVMKQWGDDWNDAPYEHNAGAPYADEGVTIECVYFDADFQTPDDGYTNSPYSVERINRGEVPWLRDRYRGTLVTIMAGTTLAEFRRLVSEAGGHVYERTARTELSALKARAEAAEGLLREAREMLDNGRECDDCGPSVTDLKRRIDAALQAAMETP
jgi:hypothetical protein